MSDGPPSERPHEWGQGPQGPPPYPQGYGPRRTESTAIAALVLAILSFVVCPVVLAIVALVLVSSSKRKIAESGGTLDGEGLLTATRILAWINIALGGLMLLFGVVVSVAAVTGMGG